jgi:hypothetical protein
LGLVLFLPFLLIKGQEMEIKHGTLFITFVDKDTPVSIALPNPEAAVPAAPAAAPTVLPAPAISAAAAAPASSPPQPATAEPLAQQLRVRAIREVTDGREFGTVMIGDVIVFRISTAFEGRHQLQRAEIVAEKLNRFLGQGLKPDEVKLGNLSGTYVILARDEILLSIDDELARNIGTNPSALALLWTSQIQDALSRLR